KMWERLPEIRCVVQRVPEDEPIFEILAIERDGGLKLRNAAGGILLKPIHYAEMVAGRRELGIEVDGALEGSRRLLAPVQHNEQKSDFVLDASGLGIERGGSLPGR